MKHSLLLAALAVSTIVLAHDEPHGKPITITGQVIDTGCYFSHDAPEAGHAACAKMCARNGIPLALVDDKGTIYMVIATEHQNPNTKLMPFIEKTVKVSGTLVEKGGIHGIVIKTIVDSVN